MSTGGDMITDTAAKSAMFMVEKLVGGFLSTGIRLKIALARSIANKAWWLTKILSPGRVRELLEMMEGLTNELKKIGNIQGGDKRRSFHKRKKRINSKRRKSNKTRKNK